MIPVCFQSMSQAYPEKKNLWVLPVGAEAMNELVIGCSTTELQAQAIHEF